MRFRKIQLDKELKLHQRIIVSITCFFSLGLIAFAIAGQVDYDQELTNTWSVWLICVLGQAWLQNRIWSDRFQLIVIYPYMPFTKIRTFFVGLIGIIALGMGSVIIGDKYVNKEYPFSDDCIKEPATESTAVYIPLLTSSRYTVESGGLKFTIKWPIGHSVTETNRPNVLAKISNYNSSFYANLMIEKYDYTISESKGVEILSSGTLKGMLPPEFEYFGDSRVTIDGEMGAYIDTYTFQNISPTTYRSFQRMYYIIYDRYMIRVNFYANGTESKQELKSKFDQYMFLAEKMTESIIIESKGNE